MLNVVIADDHQLFVESLRLLLQSTDAYHFNISGIAYTGDELVTLLKTNKPDLLLLDVNIPTKNGLEALQEAKKGLKGTRVLVLTMYDDPKIIKSAFDMNVDGYLLKNCGKDELLIAIETIMSGEVYIGKGVSVANNTGELSSFEDIFQKRFSLTKREIEVLRLITQARNNGSIAKELYAKDDFGVELEAEVYALDSTTIDLCLSLFPWARFRRTKGAIKLHTLLNLRGSIPEFIHISDGKLHDVNILDILIPQPGSFYLMDRGYVDFARLYTIQQASAFFVTRCKRNFQFKRRYSHPVDKSTGLRSDQTIITTGVDTAKEYPI
ncbi:MAG: response regulator, partial [Saprospiraceae bacterium]|nr:response regulator [Saprospiraceae bacterium]